MELFCLNDDNDIVKKQEKIKKGAGGRYVKKKGVKNEKTTWRSVVAIEISSFKTH